MSASGPRTSEDQAGFQIGEVGEHGGHEMQQRPAQAEAERDGIRPPGPSPAQPGNETAATGPIPPRIVVEQAANKTPGNLPTAKKAEAASKTRGLAALSKMGLSKATGAGKVPGASDQGKLDKKVEKAAGAKKTGAAKGTPEEPKVADMAELRVVFPQDPSSVPRVDFIAIHDIDETLQKAWLYRKRTKRRGNDSRVAYASGGINSHDGEGGLGTAGSPAPGRHRWRQPPPTSKKKTADNSNHSIETWLAISAGPAVDEEVHVPRDLEPVSEAPPDDHGPSNPIFAPVEEEHNDLSIFSMLAAVPEDDDGPAGMQTPDDIHFWQRRIRRRPTLPNERRKAAGRITTTAAEEKKVPSVGEVGDGRRYNGDVLSDRQSSLDQGIERRVNWLSDPDMLPNEVPGARVMCYTYKSTEKVASAWKYLTELAEDLVKRIIQKRTSDGVDYGRVPIVLVGLGFGSLILQRAINLLAIPGRTDANPSTDLDMIAGLVLLDAPSPGPDRELFPRSRSQETKKTWTQDWLGKARSTSATPSSKIDTLSMWSKFSTIASAYNIPIAWHYSPMVATAGKPAITPKNLEVSLIPKQSTTAHRLSRFESPSDVDYRSIMDTVKRSLIVKCAITKSDKLAACLGDFLLDRFPVDLRDQLSRTALHLAVNAANPGAVKRLLFQGKASVMRKDIGGSSPLHIAVRTAANMTWHPDRPPDQVEEMYTQIIHLLLKNGARVDDMDNIGKTPWSYAEGDGHQWIRRLKDKYLIIGSSSTTSRGMESVLPPQPGPQREACNAFDMILAEVFLQKKRERFSEVFNFDVASVYDTIYKGGSGVSQIFAASRPDQLTQDKVRCRWIHVPSNNEQWVHDLMVSMGIQDSSMGGQRHEGSRLIDRYMMPQARRYKHYHGTSPKKTPPEPKPRANRFGSTDSVATVVLGSLDSPSMPPPTPGEPWSKQASKASKTPAVPEFTRTESDAIVIFMPILGFETHRHRKYLTQAFREADNALQIARARDNSPDRRSSANPKSTGSQKGNRKKGAESSDDGESSSEGESSRIYQSHVVRPGAREQIRTRREAQLLSGYLDSKQVKPVHCRRTLDQFSYYMLNSTEARDKSQVAYRWAKTAPVGAEAKNRPIVMVDQLWLWAFHDGTVITSSPNTWNGHEDFNLSRALVEELRRNKDRRVIKSVEDLLHLVLKTSVDYFRRQGPANFQFHECFQSSINNVSEKQGQLFDDFRHTTRRLHVGTLDPGQRKKEIEFLFSLDDETELLVEIMDIQDELTIVKTILGQQHDVLEKLLRLYPKKADEDADEEPKAPGGLGKGELMVLQSLVQLLRDQAAPNPSPAKPVFRDAFQGRVSGITPTDEQVQEGQFPKRPRLNMKGKEKEGEQLPKPTPPPVKTNILQNRDLMYETIGIVENNIRVVTDMLAYAEKVESSLENLLDLKQKHANGWEARFAREGSEETQRQGNIILVFTLVTVVFLPLSFITSFFALNIDIFPMNPDTGEVNWPIGQVSGYLFGFSAVIFIPLIFLALYVNALIANIKQIYKQLLKALKEPDALLNPAATPDADADHDSDEERTYVDRRTNHPAAQSDRYGLARETITRTGQGVSDDGGNQSATTTTSDNSSDDNKDKPSRRYAPLFGRYHLHRRIPLLRNLWRYRRYRQRDARRRENRWRDTYVRDYPLRHYRSKVNMSLLRVLVAVLAFCGSEKHRRARARDKRRRTLMGRMVELGGSDSETSSDSSSGGEKGGREEVERRDFGTTPAKRNNVKGLKRKKSLSSGYWKRGRAGNGSRGDEMGSLERWSNQTRSRGSLPGEGGDDGGEGIGVAADMGRKGKLAWLRMRRKGRVEGVVDEERVIGDSDGDWGGQWGKGVKRRDG